MKRFIPFLCGLVLIAGCASKTEVVTDAAMAADPSGTWIGPQGSPEIVMESDGKLNWKQGDQAVEGKWSSPSANQLVLELPDGAHKYRFERDMFGIKLTGEDGKTLSLTTM